ncbi:MAG: antibiotic biosynthesis monooxygenase family protein [Dehalococcoidales bacterium]
MFARVTRIEVKSDKVDEAIKIYTESVTPARKAQKGSRGAYLFTDRKTGKGMAITLWDSEADAIANEQSGYYQEQLSKFKDVFAAPSVREGYEVSYQD